MIRSIVLGLAMAIASLPLYAQIANEEDDTVAKVETEGGVIMISDPGEFTTALPDQRVRKDARLMVSEDSVATVVYDNGCRKKYDEPGVYEISATCVLAYVAGGGPSTSMVVGGAFVLGVTVWALIDHGSDNDTDNGPPVSR